MRMFDSNVRYALLALSLLVSFARADVAVYQHPPHPAGGQYKSAWYAEDGLDSDEHVWDSFTLSSGAAITRISWRGAYTNYLVNAGLAPVYNFTVGIYGSTAANSQPNVVAGPLVEYDVGGNAGETPAGSAGGVNMYDYSFTLPSAFQAAAGTKYWVQIEAWQGLTPVYFWPPDWSIARGVGDNNSHFRRVGGTGGFFSFITGDATFTLFTSGAPTALISASALPAGSGLITGTGAYPIGSVCTLEANANAGWGFVNWTENGGEVSNNPAYTFTVSTDRTLTANFVNAYSITTSAQPSYGGTTSGDGIYNADSTVTVSAVPAQGFEFVEWNWFGTPISNLATYSFPATQDLSLTAVFANVPGGATFDFDDAPVHTSLPIALSAGGIDAWFSGTGSGFSIQPANTLGFTPAGFAGLCVYPSSVFPADLVVDFGQTLTDLSIMYTPQELGCDDSATMRVTAFMNGMQVGTSTATVPSPGTWPTGKLEIAVPGGFDRAVVHYDHPPPTCQDYGVIFLADNMTVVRLCAPASISSDPASISVCPGGTALFSVGGGGTEPIDYQWLHDGTPIDPLTNPSATTASLVIAGVQPTESGEYACIVANFCSSTLSAAATLQIGLLGDADGDALVSFSDITSVLSNWGADYTPGWGPGDANADALVDFADVTAVLSNWGSGCP